MLYITKCKLSHLQQLTVATFIQFVGRIKNNSGKFGCHKINKLNIANLIIPSLLCLSYCLNSTKYFILYDMLDIMSKYPYKMCCWV